MSPLQQAPLPPERVAEEIERVLARPDFADLEAGAFEDLLLRLVAFLERIGASDFLGSVLRTVILVAGVTAIALAVRAVLAARGAAEAERGAGAAPDAAATVAGPAGAALALARELAAAGRHAEAMHALYRGALLWLDQLGHARFDEGKTGGDYAREVARSAAPLARPFRGLLARFYPVAFGGRRADPAAWSAMRSAATELGVPE